MNSKNINIKHLWQKCFSVPKLLQTDKENSLVAISTSIFLYYPNISSLHVDLLRADINCPSSQAWSGNGYNHNENSQFCWTSQHMHIGNPKILFWGKQNQIVCDQSILAKPDWKCKLLFCASAEGLLAARAQFLRKIGEDLMLTSTCMWLQNKRASWLKC